MADKKKEQQTDAETMKEKEIEDNTASTDKHEENEAAEMESQDLQNEFDELQNKFHRLYAEFDNYRRRTAREMLDNKEFAGQDLMVSLLQILDDFDRAIKSNEDTQDAEGLKEGFKLIHHKFKSIMEQKGLEHMDSMGKKFDTDHHDAITQIPAPKKKLKGKVVDVIEKGYFLKGKVIRHAKVVIGQ